MDFKKLANQYRDELLENVLPFWLDHSQDHESGGYFSCLDREGKVFDTDKFIWLQGREVWMFSMLYNKVEKRQEWLDCAVQGGEFLKKYGHDGQFNWYFSLDRSGRPLVERFWSIHGVSCPIRYVPIHKANPAMDMASPRTLVGYISERSTNTTAQMETAQQNT